MTIRQKVSFISRPIRLTHTCSTPTPNIFLCTIEKNETNKDRDTELNTEASHILHQNYSMNRSILI